MVVMLPTIWACSVCYGDSASAMAQGARAGVLFLMCVIALVLAAVAGLACFWARRARALQPAVIGSRMEKRVL